MTKTPHTRATFSADQLMLHKNVNNDIKHSYPNLRVDNVYGTPS
jgi:hypothetical protein